MPAHQALADKVAAARRLRDEVGIRRTIMLDDIAGRVHAAYGLMPNATFVLGRGGTILYKAMWTSAERVAEFIEGSEGQSGRIGHAPFHTEQWSYRRLDREAFVKRLEVNGMRAVREWHRANEIWAARARERAAAARR